MVKSQPQSSNEEVQDVTQKSEVTTVKTKCPETKKHFFKKKVREGGARSGHFAPPNGNSKEPKTRLIENAGGALTAHLISSTAGAQRRQKSAFLLAPVTMKVAHLVPRSSAPFLKKETELLTVLLYRQQPRKSMMGLENLMSRLPHSPACRRMIPAWFTSPVPLGMSLVQAIEKRYVLNPISAINLISSL